MILKPLKVHSHDGKNFYEGDAPKVVEGIVPMCPHCGHEMTDEEMSSNQYVEGDDGDDLWALAPREDRTYVICPSVTCGKGYYLQGGYTPKYTSAIGEDDL